MQVLIIFVLLILSHLLTAVATALFLKGAPAPKKAVSIKEDNIDNEIKKLNTILKNIEVYDGSSKGQQKL